MPPPLRITPEPAWDSFPIRANPSLISFYVGRNTAPFQRSISRLLAQAPKASWAAYRLMLRYSPYQVRGFVIPSKHYRDPVPVEGWAKFKKVEDLLKHRDKVHESKWFAELKARVQAKGIATHKKHTMTTVTDVEAFLNDHVLGLVRSMESDGYDERRGKNFPHVTVGQGGVLHKSNRGDHRFIVAKLVGVTSMPFVVRRVHEDWLRSHFGLERNLTPERLRPAIERATEAYQ